jgi:hypothetical protein
LGLRLRPEAARQDHRTRDRPRHGVRRFVGRRKAGAGAERRGGVAKAWDQEGDAGELPVNIGAGRWGFPEKLSCRHCVFRFRFVWKPRAGFSQGLIRNNELYPQRNCTFVAARNTDASSSCQKRGRRRR